MAFILVKVTFRINLIFQFFSCDLPRQMGHKSLTFCVFSLPSNIILENLLKVFNLSDRVQDPGIEDSSFFADSKDLLK